MNGAIPDGTQPMVQPTPVNGAAATPPASAAPAPQGNDPASSPYVAAAMAIMGINQGMNKQAATIPDTPQGGNKQASGATAFGNAAKAASRKMG